MKKAVIIGAGTQGQVYASYLKEAGINLIGFMDDNPDLIGKDVIGLPVLGKYKDLFKPEFKELIQDVYCPIGINSVRVKYLSTLKKEGYNIPNFIHPSVSIAPDVEIGEGVYMLVGNIVMPHTKLGNYIMINMDSTIAHHVELEDGVFLSSGVNIGANINVRKNAYIGMGVTIMTGISEVGKESLMGAGTTIIKDVPCYATMVGNPGRMIRHRYADVTFVGSGISSSFTLWNLLKKIESEGKNTKTTINVIDKYPEFITGIPYGSRSGFTTLLITSLRNFLIESERGDFINWLNANKERLIGKLLEEGNKLSEKWVRNHQEAIANNDWEELFIPRRFFGVYIEEKLNQIIESLTDKGLVEVNFIKGEVFDLEKDEENTFKIFLKKDLPYFTKKVILAVGSMPTKYLWKDEALIELPNLMVSNEPYAPELSKTLEKVNAYLESRATKKTNILIVGANASALELIYKLNDTDYKNENYNFVFLSTHGKLPDAVIDEEKMKGFSPINLESLQSQTTLSAKDIADATYADLKLADDIELGAASSVGIISSAFGALLSKLDRTELENFASLYGNDIGRHQRCAGLHYLNNIYGLRDESRFEHLAGRFVDLKGKNGDYYLEYLDTKSQKHLEYNEPFHLVINCVGGKNLTQEDIPSIFKNLMEKEYCIPNKSKIGFKINDNLESIKDLHIMGPLVAGNVIDNKAVWHVEHCGRIIWLSKVLSKQIFEDLDLKKKTDTYHLEVNTFKTEDEIKHYGSLLKKEWNNNIFYSVSHLKYSTTKEDQVKYFVFFKNKKPLILMPIILKGISIGTKDYPFYDAASPYGYTGPLFNKEDVHDSDLKAFWKQVNQWYSNNNVITEFVRFNLSQNQKHYNGYSISTLNNVIGELTNFEEIWTNLKQKVRNNYRKALNNNLKFKIYSGIIPDDVVDEFYGIFSHTMKRVEAKHDYTLFSKDYFAELVKNHVNNAFIAVVYSQETPISTELIINVQDTMYSYLGGTLSEYFSMRPNDFLKIEVIKWGLANNKKYYVLGGGRGKSDSLYQYKKSFFPKDEDIMFYTGRKIIDNTNYNELLAKMDISYTEAKDYIEDATKFFPLYSEERYKKASENNN